MEDFLLDLIKLISKETKYLFSTKNIDNNYYINYFNDIEHGFFHCFCCCYISYIINNKKLDEPLIYSLLLHDFLKCNDYSQKEHDKKLIDYYPNLITETYTHSDPLDENKCLITCDRIELRRYKDFNNWVDNRYYKLYDNMSKKQTFKIEYFYKKLRPVLEKIYTSENYKNIAVKNNNKNFQLQIYHKLSLLLKIFII
tara:strand:- start:98 stop:691 length:594 start_codon:yes stop_codon:yes gene_type:complete